MKGVLIVLLFFSTQLAGGPPISEEINYIPRGEEANVIATRLIKKAFNGHISVLFNKPLIIGPGLWKQIKDEDAIKTSGIIQTDISVESSSKRKVYTLHGGLAKTKVDIFAFRKFITPLFKADYSIRKLNAKEMKIYWSLIPYDIQEPVFVLESSNRKLLLDFDIDESMHVFYIDDISKF